MPRPKKPEGTKLTHTAVRLPVPVKEQLDRLSQLTGLSLQEHIRRAIETHIEEQQREKGYVLFNVSTPPHRRRKPAPAPELRPRRRPSFLGAAA